MTGNIDRQCEQRALVTVTRGIEDVENLHGYVLQTSPELVLIHEVTEFHLDGYCVFNRADVERSRFTAFEKYRAAMLKAEGEQRKVGLAEKLDLESWLTCFKSLKAIGRNVIVECERPEVDTFAIGQILRVNKRSIAMRCFDALGRFEADSTRIRYDDITLVTFDDEYVTIFSKYLREQ